MPSPDCSRQVVAQTLITTVIRETAASEPGPTAGRPALSEPGPGPYTRALAATYERYAAELAEIEALRNHQHSA
jgi:hypothetical protein